MYIIYIYIYSGYCLEAVNLNKHEIYSLLKSSSYNASFWSFV